MREIIRASTYFHLDNAGAYRDLKAQQFLQFGFSPAKLDAARPLTAPSIFARIDHGRWMADCPFCRGAEFADPAYPWFACASCGNEAVDGKFVKVWFPGEALREQIEAVLRQRKYLANMNWRPGETIQDLEDENQEHGIV